MMRAKASDIRAQTPPRSALVPVPASRCFRSRLRAIGCGFDGLTSKQCRQLCSGLLLRSSLRTVERAWARPEVIAEIGPVFLFDFFGVVLAAFLCDTWIVGNAHPADMQLRAAGSALFQPSQWQRQRCQGSAAVPADQLLGHNLVIIAATRGARCNCLRAPV